MAGEKTSPKINYPYIPEGREIKYVPDDNPFMRLAENLRNTQSTDGVHPTGAVVVFRNEVIGTGANQSRLKSKRARSLHKRGFCIRRMLKIPSGQKYWLCPGCALSKHHAELRSIRDILRNGKSAKGADMYLYGHWWCCKPCWDGIQKAGIRNVYLLEGSERLFDRNHPDNIVGGRFKL
ncbi:MAG: hypothetical protein UX77_C0003G0059 [Parcubacteria group bacterium GW2011_GWA1_47_11]|nr:MAG: hypothetical protein UX77_C0003G0059 [Parcubacteria group bacterium GW2011_GWA1_47_11]